MASMEPHTLSQTQTDLFFAGNVPMSGSRLGQVRPQGQSRTRKRKLVLVVDDEPIITETLTDILHHEGFDVVAASDGLAAVETAINLKPDIVLADVAMPRLNGVEAAKRVMAVLPKTRIILFSGQAETADLLAEARREGFEFEVLAKPVKPQQLLLTLRED
jgi:CheY-like chemotaxis protein